jgi:hypothetical protein
MVSDWRTLSIGLVLLSLCLPLSASLIRRIMARRVDLIGLLVYGAVLSSGVFFGAQLMLDGLIGKQFEISFGLVAR